MRFILKFLFIILFFPHPLFADVLVGRIIAVDAQKGEMILVSPQCSSCQSSTPCPCGEKTDMQMRQDFKRAVVSFSGPIPCFAKPHSIVRVWGKFDGDNRFLAQRIAGPGYLHAEQDSTGVRSRLRKRCFIKDKHHPKAGGP